MAKRGRKKAKRRKNPARKAANKKGPSMATVKVQAAPSSIPLSRLLAQMGREPNKRRSKKKSSRRRNPGLGDIFSRRNITQVAKIGGGAAIGTMVNNRVLEKLGFGGIAKTITQLVMAGAVRKIIPDPDVGRGAQAVFASNVIKSLFGMAGIDIFAGRRLTANDYRALKSVLLGAAIPNNMDFMGMAVNNPGAFLGRRSRRNTGLGETLNPTRTIDMTMGASGRGYRSVLL